MSGSTVPGSGRDDLVLPVIRWLSVAIIPPFLVFGVWWANRRDVPGSGFAAVLAAIAVMYARMRARAALSTMQG